MRRTPWRKERMDDEGQELRRKQVRQVTLELMAAWF